MDAQDLRKLLESKPNKLKVFEDKETLAKCNFTVPDLCSLIQDFLTDEEKLKLFDFSHFQNLQRNIRLNIVKTINDYNLTVKALLSPTNKDFSEFDFKGILENKDESEKIKMLENKELVTEKFHLSVYEITDFIKEFSNDDDKKRFMDFYELDDFERSNIIKTFKLENKLEEIKKDTFSVFNKIDLIRTLNSNELLQFINENKEFLNENNINIYNITADMDDKSQLDFIKHLEDFDMSLNEKRDVLALLNETVKEQLDLDSFPEEYRTALEMYKPDFSSRVNVDIDTDLERYKGLDKIISVCPEDFDENQRAKFLKLCNICPDMSVISNIGIFSTSSTPAEYIEAEEWISSVLEKLNPEYSDIQKLAIIDNEYGKRTSYSANFETETYNEWDPRALWKILSTNELGAINGGVCNGHAHAV